MRNLQAPWVAVLVLLLGWVCRCITAAETCCLFIESDPSNCVVYGQLGDDKLIAWNKASQSCLDAFQIKDQAIDPTTLNSIFPNPDGSNGNINGFVNYLKFNRGNSMVEGVLASLDAFFVEDSSTKLVWKDSITVSGTSYNCKSDESTCWNALKAYFATTEGAAILQDQGKVLHNAQRVSREKEQSLVRIRLCEAGATSTCGALSDQVQSVKSENPTKACSAFGLGPAENKTPCSSAISASLSNTTNSTSSNSTKSNNSSKSTAEFSRSKRTTILVFTLSILLHASIAC